MGEAHLGTTTAPPDPAPGGEMETRDRNKGEFSAQWLWPITSTTSAQKGPAWVGADFSKVGARVSPQSHMLNGASETQTPGVSGGRVVTPGLGSLAAGLGAPGLALVVGHSSLRRTALGMSSARLSS